MVSDPSAVAAKGDVMGKDRAEALRAALFNIFTF
jgi:hypothetical protein